MSADRVLRTVTAHADEAYRRTRDAGIYRRLVERGMLVPLAEIDAASSGVGADDARFVLEHPRLEMISWPYEWCFSAHRSAALLHLDLHLDALEHGFTLSDASAYNVQFQGSRPIFIDHLSLRPYREGELWAGHRQFCMQFLNPLLMHAILGVAPNAWFRGALEGIAPEDLARLMPWRSWLSWTVLTHVHMQARLQNCAPQAEASGTASSAPRLSLNALKGLLTGLRSYIASLKPPGGSTEWSGYADANSYSDSEAERKRAFVSDMASHVRPRQLWDIGCNTGAYSAAALAAGAHCVIGWDYDHGALNKAFARSEAEGLNFLPLWLDAANPSPDQGWAQSERRGFASRGAPDALIALAFIHHIAIGRNIPLRQAVDWLIDRAPVGVIEFPVREDAMVQRLLQHRDIPFQDYTDAAFLAHVTARARIVRSERVNDGTRLLVWYDRSA